VGGQARVKLGEVEALPGPSIQGTTLVVVSIDARIYHELEEHDALLWTGGPFAPMYWT
jgi:hypothetical protein